ncbi:MAG: D-alanyl-D-alanine carboxypeptidase [Actinomycetales bacterium]|nr:D-alanyl-D-alanine carboxypeptidase [Actinomycetales bacterium]
MPTELLPPAPPAAPSPAPNALTPFPPTPAPAAAPTELLPPTAEPEEGAAPPRSGIVAGIGALFRRHPRAWLAGGIAAAFALLGTGSLLGGAAYGAATAAEPTVVSDALTVDPRTAPGELLDPAALPTCSITPLTAGAGLGTLRGTVIDATTGATIWSREGATGSRPNHLVRLATGIAALSVLGGDARISTTVNDGSLPGSIVLTARGDATLSAMPPGTDSVYSGAPKLADLAQQTIAAYNAAHPGVPIETLVLDTSYWSADPRPQGWPSNTLDSGQASLITPLQVDGDRGDPTRLSSPRGDDPIGDAASDFVAALRAADPGGVVGADVAITSGSALGSAPVLGTVQSRPVSTLVDQMLDLGDNTLAEMLGRLVAIQSGFDGSSASVGKALVSALAVAGVPTTGMTLVDASGLSSDDVMPTDAIAGLLAVIRTGEAPRDQVRDALGVAGQSGSLADRGAGTVLSGNLHGAASSLNNGSSIAGYLTAADGTELVVAFAAHDAVDDSTAGSLDALVAGVATCGSNLAQV